MNATPIQPGSSDRDELARLLPEPAERDLPSGRHQRLQEFVMSQIQQDLRPAEQPPRRSRRPVALAGALAAVAAAAVAAVAIGAGGSGGSGAGSTAPATPRLSGRQVLLAAATTAEREPAGTGTYWYVKGVIAGGSPLEWESWKRHDGETWFRGDHTGGKMFKLLRPIPFRLGGTDVSLERLQKLPTEPEALKASIAYAVKQSDVRTSAGRPDAATRERMVFDGLISLVSQLPAPPRVRAAAFRAIAAYPNVKDLGPVRGGQGLQFSLSAVRPTTAGRSPGGKDDDARLVIDPVTSQIRETNYFVTPEGGKVTAPDGATLVTGWTDVLPK
jgi:hypothetical protein